MYSQHDYRTLMQASSLIALSAILYGFLGYLGTAVLNENFTISAMLFWRFFIAGSWMLCFTVKNCSPRVFSKELPVLLGMFVLGAIGYAGSSEFYFLASQFTGTGLAMVIFFCYPIIIAVISWLRNPQHFNKYTFVLLSTMSVGLLLLRDPTAHGVNWLGISFGIIAALCYALYIMGSKRFSLVSDANVITTIVCYGCACIFFILALATKSFVLPHTAKTWWNLLALGVLATALPIQLMLKGLRYVSSMRASIISVLEPIVTVLVGVVMLHEFISGVQMLGVIIILCSALLVQFHKEL